MLCWVALVIIYMVIGYMHGKSFRRLNDRIYKDNLTGLRNRGYFYPRVICELDSVQKNKQCFSLAFIDIDNFKQVNDNLGHLKGDGLIKDISAAIKDNIRETDELIRWGGDEFVILFPRTDKDSACRIAERVRRKIEDEHFYRGILNCSITLSIGIVQVNDGIIDVENLIDYVDQAVYKSKEIKNTITVLE